MDQVDERPVRKLNWTRILSLVWLFLGIVVLLLVCGIAVNGFRPRPQPPVEIGDVNEFPPGSITLKYVNTDYFDQPTGKQFETLPLDVVRDNAGNFTIFYGRSTNPAQGILVPRQCVVNWDDSLQKFLELCGGSQWTRDGKYVAGPAPRDLDSFMPQIVDGKLTIEPTLIQGSAHP